MRAQLAWKHICGLLPLARRRAGAVYYGREENIPMAQCIIIGTNKSEADLALAQNLEVISEVWKILQVDAKPEWFRLVCTR